uniref:[histone H4]-lysine(20) N-methyltransferase n=1 Tax=Hirondellea gigas TaxID=1518452 RepID=A0A2P2IC12_9CRUS
MMLQSQLNSEAAPDRKRFKKYSKNNLRTTTSATSPTEKSILDEPLTTINVGFFNPAPWLAGAKTREHSPIRLGFFNETDYIESKFFRQCNSTSNKNNLNEICTQTFSSESKYKYESIINQSFNSSLANKYQERYEMRSRSQNIRGSNQIRASIQTKNNKLNSSIRSRTNQVETITSDGSNQRGVKSTSPEARPPSPIKLRFFKQTGNQVLSSTTIKMCFFKQCGEWASSIFPARITQRQSRGTWEKLDDDKDVRERLNNCEAPAEVMGFSRAENYISLDGSGDDGSERYHSCKRQRTDNSDDAEIDSSSDASSYNGKIKLLSFECQVSGTEESSSLSPNMDSSVISVASFYGRSQDRLPEGHALQQQALVDKYFSSQWKVYAKPQVKLIRISDEQVQSYSSNGGSRKSCSMLKENVSGNGRSCSILNDDTPASRLGQRKRKYTSKFRDFCGSAFKNTICGGKSTSISPVSSNSSLTSHIYRVRSCPKSKKWLYMREALKNRNENVRQSCYKPINSSPSSGRGSTGRALKDSIAIRKPKRQTARKIRNAKLVEIQNKVSRKCQDGLKVKEFKNKGRGVITTKLFARGDFVVEYAGDLTSLEEAHSREKLYETDDSIGCYMYYFKFNSKRYCIDATVESDYYGRLVNHSRYTANLNTKIVVVNDRPHLILEAKLDLVPGTELLLDYGDRDRETLECNPWLRM